jgi:hypothetical protein
LSGAQEPSAIVAAIRQARAAAVETSDE